MRIFPIFCGCNVRLTDPKQLARFLFLPLIFRPIVGVSGQQRPLTNFFCTWWWRQPGGSRHWIMTVISIPEEEHKRKCLDCRSTKARTTLIFDTYFQANSWSKRQAETFNHFFLRLVAAAARWQSTLNHDGHQHSWRRTQKENGGRSFVASMRNPAKVTHPKHRQG